VSLLANLPLHFEPTASVGEYVARGRNYALALGERGATLHLRRGEELAALDLQLEGAQAAAAQGENRLPGVSNYFVGADRSQWRANVPHYARVRYEGVYPGVDLVYYGAGRDLEYDFIVAPGADPKQIRLSYRGAQDVRIDSQGNLRIGIDGGEVVHRKPVVYQTLASGVRASVAGAFRIIDDAAHAAATIVAFDLGDYDVRLPLVIDPVLTYATYLGGGFDDEIRAIAVDSVGAVYVAGATLSNDIPVTSGAFDMTLNGGYDAFVAKLNAAGTALEYASYLGGSSFEIASALRIDGAGAAYVMGVTSSNNFPTSAGAPQPAFGGAEDVFVAKLNATGATLLYSTYIGGSNQETSDDGGGFAIDAAGNAYVYAATASTNFPVTPGAPQSVRGNPNAAQFDEDAFLTKINAAGDAFAFSTYHGGESIDQPYDTGSLESRQLVVQADGSAWIAGATESSDFPVTPGAFDTTFNGPAGGFPGGGDAFVARFDTVASARTYSTYLGGADEEFGGPLAVDDAGNAHVAVQTDSGDFPTTAGAFDETFNGGSSDVAVVKLGPTGAGPLLYSTYLGGSDVEGPAVLRIDAAGAVFIAGSTQSTDFPTSGGVDTTHNGGGNDGFIAKLDPAGGALMYSTYAGSSDSEGVSFMEIDALGSAYAVLGDAAGDAVLTTGGRPHVGNYDDYFVKLDVAGSALLDASYVGGAGDDSAFAMTIDAQQNLYLVGFTNSADYPTTAGVVQGVKAGGAGNNDGYIVKLATTPDGGAPPPTPQPGVVQLSAASYSVNENGGSVTLTLTRTGGADGAISVNVVSGGGSAAAGSDYTALTQTIDWASGDAAAKTVLLGIINDGADEPDETISIALSNATGGAALGATSSATVTIVDDDPAAVTPPPAPPPAAQNSGARGSYGGGAMGGVFLLIGLALAAIARERRLFFPSSSRMRGPIRSRMGPRLRGGDERRVVDRIVASTALVLSTNAVHAAADDAASGWFIGVRGGVAESTLDEGELERALAARGHSTTVSLDDQEPSWSLFGGYRWASGLGLEANVVDLGEYDATISGSSTAPGALLADARSLLADAGRGAGAALSWRWAIGERFAVTPRIGAYYWESERTLTTGAQNGRRTENGLNLMGGVAFGVEITPAWSLALGWDVYDAGGRNDLRGYSASVEYRFGR
jgi:hypothetical protein